MSLLGFTRSSVQNSKKVCLFSLTVHTFLDDSLFQFPSQTQMIRRTKLRNGAQWLSLAGAKPLNLKQTCMNIYFPVCCCALRERTIKNYYFLRFFAVDGRLLLNPLVPLKKIRFHDLNCRRRVLGSEIDLRFGLHYIGETVSKLWPFQSET